MKEGLFAGENWHDDEMRRVDEEATRRAQSRQLWQQVWCSCVRTTVRRRLRTLHHKQAATLLLRLT
jgi:hypothetical protein